MCIGRARQVKAEVISTINPTDSYSARNVNPEYLSQSKINPSSSSEPVSYFVPKYTPQVLTKVFPIQDLLITLTPIATVLDITIHTPLIMEVCQVLEALTIVFIHPTVTVALTDTTVSTDQVGLPAFP